ncbi:MAG: site-specific integrase [Proteobacteria bacterium]|nr:site-specific integrase [Pseudomonadota bacterium]
MKIEKRKRKTCVRYRARFMMNNSEFRSSWLDSEKLAKDWASQKRTEILAGQVNTGVAMPLSMFAALWIEKHVEPNKEHSAGMRDKQVLRRHVLPKLGHVKLRSLNTQQIEFLLADIKRSGLIKPKTINNLLGTVKKMLNDAVRWGMIQHNPASAIRPLKIQRQEVTTFTSEETRVLLGHTHQHFIEEYRLIVFALNTGCRLGECLGLDWSKVDLQQGTALIDSIFDGSLRKVVMRTKGKKFRKIPLNESICKVLREMALDGRKAESPLIFSRIDYEYLSHEKFKRILKSAGLEMALSRRATFHSLRHTFASEFMRQSGNLYDLQHILGHSTITQTEKYAHFAPSHMFGLTNRVTFAAPVSNLIAMTKLETKVM